MLASSQALALWHLYVLFFLAGFLGAGSLFAPLVANAGNWFKTGVGLAIGIVSAGQALGQGGVPFVSAFLISAFGWRGAFASLGLIALTTLISLSMFIRKAPVTLAVKNQQNPSGADKSPVPLPTNFVIAWLRIGVLFC
jgi:sugar phosphate permease